jgi:hypothetical protein
MSISRGVVAFALVSLSGCSPKDGSDSGGSNGAGAATEVPTWHADVRPIIESSCSGCHTAGGSGGFELKTYEDVRLIKDAVADSVASRRMPPWKAVDGCTEYEHDISLSDEEIATLVDWAAADAPAGDESDSRVGTPPEVGGLDRVDLTLSLPIPYEVNTELADDYRCFTVEWPMEEDVYVTGYQVNPGRADLVHHMIAFIVPGSYADALAEMETEDDRPGYSCYGGIRAVDQIDSAWLGAWAPGAVQGELPNGLGMRMEAGNLLVLQMHYNNASGADGFDQSTIDFQVESEVERVGWIQPFTNPLWVLAGGMDIPAGAVGAEQSFEGVMPRDLTVHTANLHMHTMGRTGRMEVERTDGSKDCMVQIDDWDFDWQRSYQFAEPIKVNEGDTWRLECTWDNPTDVDVDWGEGTGDEMCLGTALVSLD